MIRLTCSLDIGDYTFPFVNEVEIISTWDQITDTATIKIPRNIKVRGSITAGETGIWRRNDPVRISAGYNDDNDLRFDGVLTRVSPKLPLEFHCEDKMFLLKQHTITKEVIKTVNRDTSLTLRKLLQYIMPIDPFTGENYILDVDDFEMPKFAIKTPVTVVELFNYLKKDPFGLSIYFQDGELHAGVAYKFSSINEIATGDLSEFEFQKNIIDDSQLDYIRDDDVMLKISLINRDQNNVITKFSFGDPDGELRTINTYNLNPAEINKIGNEALTKYKYEGFRGSFTTFLQPMVKHGDAVKMIDPLILGRKGVYLIRQVVTRFGMDGGRQEITLDRKIA